MAVVTIRYCVFNPFNVEYNFVDKEQRANVSQATNLVLTL